MLSEKVIIINESGIHARPASKLVSIANTYKCSVQLEVEEKKVNAKSLLSLLGLGLTKGAEVTIHTEGDDETVALNAVVNLINEGFGE
jgi:phosphocarrier protein